MGIKVLYAGDSPVGGAANYLLGILKKMNAAVTHVAPSEKISKKVFKKNFDVIIFSDYSKNQVDRVTEEAVLKQVREGAGFLMIGGWGSFSGPFGGWKGSKIEKILPVKCKGGDDRTNFPGGASLSLKDSRGFLDSKWFEKTPAICGMNEIIPDSSAETVLTARRILSNGKKIEFDRREYPLLVLRENAFAGRTAALTTDLAPHWCGGLVDWGIQTLKIKVTPKIQIQIGNYYFSFVSSLLSWLAGG